MDKKLRIGIGSDAIPPTIDGISNCVDNYARLINKDHGYAIMLAPYNPNQKEYKYDYPVYTYKSWAFFVNEEYRIGWPFKECFRLDVRKMKLDLLHSHCPLASSYLFKLVIEEQKIPHILTYHTKYEYEINKRIPTKWAKDFAKNFILKNIERADEVWVTSEGSAASLREMGYTGPYVVMPNGVDMPRGKAPQADINSIVRRYRIDKSVPTLLFVGRTMWYKNIRMIFDALKRLKADGIKFQMLMVGHGKDEHAIRMYARKLGLKQEIIFTGEIFDRVDLRAFYSVADLFVFPSTFDTNGLVVREAAASKCPSVLIRGSCASEGIEEDFTAFMCDENADDLARVIKRAIGNPEKLREIGENAFSNIYISWEDAVERAYKRYEKICAEWNYEDR